MKKERYQTPQVEAIAFSLESGILAGSDQFNTLGKEDFLKGYSILDSDDDLF